MSGRTMVAVILAGLFAAGALAQEARPDDVSPQESAATGEFARASGGRVEAITKETRQKLSGSLGMTVSQSQLSAGDARNGFQATLGGAILEDRLWFFAAAEVVPQMRLAQQTTGSVIDAKMIAQLGDRNSLTASFSEGRGFAVTPPAVTGGVQPSTFLSLRYSGMVSNNLSFSANFLRRSMMQTERAFAIEQPR